MLNGKNDNVSVKAAEKPIAACNSATNDKIVRLVNNVIVLAKNDSSLIRSVYKNSNNLCKDETTENPVEEQQPNTRDFVTVAEAIH